MARKRMISPAIWEDPGFNKLSRDARLLFIGMFSNADDYGYLRADTGSLKRQVFGFDEIDTKEVHKWASEVKTLRSLHFFEDNGEIFAHFLKWHGYQLQQRDRLQDSIYPLCSTCPADAQQMRTEVSRLSKEVSKEGELNIKGRQLLKEARKKILGGKK